MSSELKLDFESLYIESVMSVGTVFNGNETFIHIRSNEGYDIPHFHLYIKDGKNTNNGSNPKTFHTCIRLDTPEYFHHKPYTGVLSNSEARILYKSLQRVYKKDKSKRTYWEVIVEEWNNDTEKKNIDVNSMPDYRLLNDGRK